MVAILQGQVMKGKASNSDSLLIAVFLLQIEILFQVFLS